ncbi:hypothetical protein KPH14_010588 [Odynerus spinipes]|uniref:Uncharacterized protein n=1 Tax=Odynerus spinipes TaxID=1348599 RepID=A0AAD9RU85_9HYME|nr:hypothetical protein KPH14_010588 [Odynerus spinipes]
MDEEFREFDTVNGAGRSGRACHVTKKWLSMRRQFFIHACINVALLLGHNFYTYFEGFPGSQQLTESIELLKDCA